MTITFPSSSLTEHQLSDGCRFNAGELPAPLIWDQADFEHFWAEHPAERHPIKIHGKSLLTPRFQQAYGANYDYSGSRNNALPIPASLRPLLEWVQAHVDPRHNGMLLNWYDGCDHYIGEHHDSTKGLIPGAPIVTLSFGETRVFRLSQGQGVNRKMHDFTATHGAVFSMPWETNLRWKHAVPKRVSYRGRRISVTLRAFATGLLPPELCFADGDPLRTAS